MAIPKAMAIVHEEIGKLPACQMVGDVNVSHVTTMMGCSATINHGLGVEIKGYDCVDIYGKPATLKVTRVDENSVHVAVDKSFLMRMMPMVYRVVLVGKSSDGWPIVKRTGRSPVLDAVTVGRVTSYHGHEVDYETRRKILTKIESKLKERHG